MTRLTRFETMGGEDGIRRIVERFYRQMSEDPNASVILAMHPSPLDESAEKLVLFLMTWWGGPSLYQERYGHPRIRAIHAAFPIDAAARDAWLMCMAAALSECVADVAVREAALRDFAVVAEHVRNR